MSIRLYAKGDPRTPPNKLLAAVLAACPQKLLDENQDVQSCQELEEIIRRVSGADITRPVNLDELAYAATLACTLMIRKQTDIINKLEAQLDELEMRLEATRTKVSECPPVVNPNWHGY